MRCLARWMVFFSFVAVAYTLGFAPPAFADGTVYAMTNQLTGDGGNNILVYHRASDGTLTLIQTIATTGGGSGVQIAGFDSLGSQGGVVLDQPHQHLFAVNTETGASNTQDCDTGTISSFLVGKDGMLTFADKASSGGLFPDSLTVKGNTLYVLNAGGPGTTLPCGIGPNITGFRVNPKNGHLSPIADSTQPIDPGTTWTVGTVPAMGLDCSGISPGDGAPPFAAAVLFCGKNPPAFPRSAGQVGFTPDGGSLIVTVKGPNMIYVFPLNADGTPGTPTVFTAPTGTAPMGGTYIPTYFGFNFDTLGNLIVSEAFGTATELPTGGAGAVSSYAIGLGGVLTPITTTVANGQGTPCWVAIDPITRGYAYISNNASPTLSSYTIGADGSLTLLAAVAATVTAPNDLAVAKDKGNAFLYVNDSGAGKVGAWKINRNGSLTVIGPAGGYSGLPVNTGAQGLAAY
jgi:6-phosphogluconolactonase